MNSPYSRARRQRPLGRKSKNFLPLLVFLVIIGLLVWGIIKVFSSLFNGEQSNSLSAEIQILKGQSEFSLPETENWTPAYSEQKFFTGDSIRTKSNSKAVLNISGGNTIFVDENTQLEFINLEEKASNYKNIILHVKEGQIWAKVADEDLNLNPKSKFEVTTTKFNLHVRGTVFNINTSSEKNTISLVKGSVDLDILGATKEDFENIKVGVGQQIVISPSTLDDIRTGKDVLEIIDPSFIESEWHIQNLGKFYPQESAQIRRRIEITAAKEVQEENKEAQNEGLEESSSLERPQITTPQAEATIPSSEDVLKVEGTAPPEAAQIVVNGFTLTKFQPGDRKWSYFAAKKFGTLVPGENTFSVYAVSRDGKKSEPSSVKIVYEGTPQNTFIQDLQSASPIAVPATSPVVTTKTEGNFMPPLVTKPEAIPNGGSYKITEDVLTLSGTVDPKTNAVLVNGYKLKKFSPGQTTFTYIASARYGVRSNLKEGENKYEILTLGPDGAQASTTITVTYTPK